MNPDSELPRGNDCPGASVTSRSHDDLSSRGNVAPGQLHCPGASSSHLITTKLSEFLQTLHKLLQRMNFKHVYLFLVLSGTPNINNEHVQDYSCPGATFAFCSHGEKLPRQGGLPGVIQWVTRLKLPRGNQKL